MEHCSKPLILNLGKGMNMALTERAFELLHELAENNNREWFHANKDEFKSEVSQPFAQVLEAISGKLAGTALPFAGGENTMFHMNRDVRFSKDKSPYKTSVSGLLTPSGTKAEDAGVIYLCLDAFGGVVAGGFHNPDGPALGRMRDQIVARPEAFETMIASLGAARLELETDGTLKRVPRGYEACAESGCADALKLKNFVTRRDLEVTDWKAGEVADITVKFSACLSGLIRFFSD